MTCRSLYSLTHSHLLSRHCLAHGSPMTASIVDERDALSGTRCCGDIAPLWCKQYGTTLSINPKKAPRRVHTKTSGGRDISRVRSMAPPHTQPAASPFITASMMVFGESSSRSSHCVQAIATLRSSQPCGSGVTRISRPKCKFRDCGRRLPATRRT